MTRPAVPDARASALPMGGPERVGSRLTLLALLVVLHGGKCCWAAGDFCWVHPSHILTLLTGLLLLLGLSLIESWLWAASSLITRFSKRPLPFLCFACSRFPREGAATAWNGPVRF